MVRGTRIETLGEVRASADYEVFDAAEEDESVIVRIVAAQQEEVEREIAGLGAKALEVVKEIVELVGSSPF